MSVDTSWTAMEAALRSLVGALPAGWCPMGCAQEYAFEIACGQIGADDAHGERCPVGQAQRVLKAVRSRGGVR